MTEVPSPLRALARLARSSLAAGRGAERNFATVLLRGIHSDVDDTELLSLARRFAEADPASADRVRRQFAAAPASYDADRALRILDAAVNHTPVAGVDVEKASLFEAEERLARSPIGDAIAEVESRAPVIAEIQRDFRRAVEAAGSSMDTRERNQAIARAKHDAMRQITATLGPGSEHPDPLMRSYVARNLALLTLQPASDDSRGLDKSISYFQRIAGPPDPSAHPGDDPGIG